MAAVHSFGARFAASIVQLSTVDVQLVGQVDVQVDDARRRLCVRRRR